MSGYDRDHGDYKELQSGPAPALDKVKFGLGSAVAMPGAPLLWVREETDVRGRLLLAT